MTSPIVEHYGPWSEDEYLALDHGTTRIELIGGNLLVHPWPDHPHQIALELFGPALDAARDAELPGCHHACVRLNGNTVVVPDLVIRDRRRVLDVVDSADVVLLGEVISPESAAIDRVLKTHLYAAARIGWLLTAEIDPITIRLYRLQGDRYFEHAVAYEGQTLTSSFPFPFTCGAAHRRGQPRPDPAV